jgi:hypothetical protein
MSTPTQGGAYASSPPLKQRWAALGTLGKTVVLLIGAIVVFLTLVLLGRCSSDSQPRDLVAASIKTTASSSTPSTAPSSTTPSSESSEGTGGNPVGFTSDKPAVGRDANDEPVSEEPFSSWIAVDRLLASNTRSARQYGACLKTTLGITPTDVSEYADRVVDGYDLRAILVSNTSVTNAAARQQLRLKGVPNVSRLAVIRVSGFRNTAAGCARFNDERSQVRVTLTIPRDVNDIREGVFRTKGVLGMCGNSWDLVRVTNVPRKTNKETPKPTPTQTPTPKPTPTETPKPTPTQTPTPKPTPTETPKPTPTQTPTPKPTPTETPKPTPTQTPTPKPTPTGTPTQTPTPTKRSDPSPCGRLSIRISHPHGRPHQQRPRRSPRRPQRPPHLLTAVTMTPAMEPPIRLPQCPLRRAAVLPRQPSRPNPLWFLSHRSRSIL